MYIKLALIVALAIVAGQSNACSVVGDCGNCGVFDSAFGGPFFGGNGGFGLGGFGRGFGFRRGFGRGFFGRGGFGCGGIDGCGFDSCGPFNNNNNSPFVTTCVTNPIC